MGEVVDEETIVRAVEAGCATQIYSECGNPAVQRRNRDNMRRYIEAAAPVLFDAGFRAGQKQAREAIEAQVARVDARRGDGSALDWAVERVVRGSLNAALASLEGDSDQGEVQD